MAVETSGRTPAAVRRTRLVAGASCGAAGLLALAATVPAWARLDVVATGESHAFRAGSMRAVLVTLAVVAGLAAAVVAWRLSRAAAIVQIAAAVPAVIVSVVVALDRIASANHQANRIPAATSTAYGPAGPLALLCSLAIVVLGLIELTLPAESRSGQADT